MVLNFQLIFWLKLFLPPLQLVQLLLLNCICRCYFPANERHMVLTCTLNPFFSDEATGTILWQLVYMAVGVLNRGAENENYVNLHANSTLQDFVLW